jgi:hypothetical protein
LARDRTVNDHDLRVLLVIRCSKVAAETNGCRRVLKKPGEMAMGNGHSIRCIFS